MKFLEEANNVNKNKTGSCQGLGIMRIIEYQVSFWSDGNILKLDGGIDAQHYKRT